VQRSRILHLLVAMALTAASFGFTTPGRGGPVPAAPQADRTFSYIEPTLDDVRTALVTRSLSCEELVQGYLDRIEAYDRQGPTLRSIIQVNPDALDDARALDATPGLSRGANTGRLHCVPVLVKDNVDVAGMPTTAGSIALVDSIPPDDAFVVQQLRDEGAIILAKANLDKFAFGFGGSSNQNLAGQATNAYRPGFGPGGSSSGSAVGVAANLGMLAIGTDTGGSLRVPATVNGIVSIRPSMRLLSQDGIIPLALFQDTAGPMCRAVQDCATMLDVMAGFDGSELSGQYTLPLQRDDFGVLLDSDAAFDEVTGGAVGTFEGALDADGLDGARIGVVRALFGNDPDVRAQLEAAIEQMESAGATVEDVTIPEQSVVTGFVSMSVYEFYDQLTTYLQSWPLAEGDTRPFSFDEVAERVEERAGTFVQRRNAGINRFENEVYNRNTLDRPAIVRERIDAALDNVDLDGNVLGEPYDALMYPSVLSLPRFGSPNAGINNRISPYAGYPALTMPAGFTEATDSRPALPVGMEFLGREFDEATLLSLAFGYQSVVEGTSLARQAPTTTPELERAAPSGPGASARAPGRQR
jgi:amidase